MSDCELVQIQKETKELEMFIEFVFPINKEVASQELKELEQATKETKKTF